MSTTTTPMGRARESGERESHTQFALPLNQEGALSVIPLGPSHKQNGRRKKRNCKRWFFYASVCVCLFFECGIKSNQIEATNGRMATTKQKIKLQTTRLPLEEEILHSHLNNAIQIGSKIKWSSASASAAAATTAATATAKQQLQRFQIELCCGSTSTSTSTQRRVACTWSAVAEGECRAQGGERGECREGGWEHRSLARRDGYAYTSTQRMKEARRRKKKIKKYARQFSMGRPIVVVAAAGLHVHMQSEWEKQRERERRRWRQEKKRLQLRALCLSAPQLWLSSA